jgi:hypothetical protein
MSDKQLIGRVKVSATGGPIESTTLVLPVTSLVQKAKPVAAEAQNPPPDKALEVLTLAQRTAAAHVNDAAAQARRMVADAEARVQQMDRDARARADQIRAEAETVLFEARNAAARSSEDAQEKATEIRRKAEMALADARAEAEKIVAAGRDQAEQLRRQAEQRYEDAVGGLSIKREALQKQVENLESFNADYRRQLASFVQKQMRALWTEQPDLTSAVEDETPG